MRENELHVYEDGVDQPLTLFTREEVPISYGLAVDTSGSLRSQLQSVIDAGKSIINTNKSGDETFLVRFISSDKIETVQDFTSNQDLLIDGLDSLYVEGGQTAVIDAVYLAAERLAEYKKGDDNDRRRRALILVTDGEDRVSFYTQEQLFARLREQDVQIYVIGFVNELDKDGGFIRKSPRERSVNLINKLASETGGRHSSRSRSRTCRRSPMRSSGICALSTLSRTTRQTRPATDLIERSKCQLPTPQDTTSELH